MYHACQMVFGWRPDCDTLQLMCTSMVVLDIGIMASKEQVLSPSDLHGCQMGGGGGLACHVECCHGILCVGLHWLFGLCWGEASHSLLTVCSAVDLPALWKTDV